jgi:hypothetical protein
MKIGLVNEGPVTIVMDSKNKEWNSLLFNNFFEGLGPSLFNFFWKKVAKNR